MASKGWFLLRDTEECTRPTCATSISYFGSCFVALSVLLQVWIGPVHGPTHEILHAWKDKLNEFAALHGIKYCRCVQQQWDLAQYISSLEDQRLAKRLMPWQPTGRRRAGRPAHLWHTVLTNFCRWKGLQHWALESRNRQNAMLPDFFHFVNL